MDNIKKSLQLLRGEQEYLVEESTYTLLDGEPFYSKQNKNLYIGNGSEIKNTRPIGATYLQPGKAIDEGSGLPTTSVQIVGNDEPFDFNSKTYITNTQNNLSSIGCGADGYGAIALGTQTYAHGDNSFTTGKRNIATNNQAISMGQGNRSMGKYSFSTNGGNITLGDYGSTFGIDNLNLGKDDFVVGEKSIVGGYANLVGGKNNYVSFYVYDVNQCYTYYCASKPPEFVSDLGDDSILIGSDRGLTLPGTFERDDRGVTIQGVTYVIGEDSYGNPCILNKANGQVVSRYAIDGHRILFALPSSGAKDQSCYNIIGGQSNNLHRGSNSNILSGKDNEVLLNSSYNIVGGEYNKVSGKENVVAGYNNDVKGRGGIVVGSDNIVDEACVWSGAIGVGLTIEGSLPKLIVGRNNDPTSNTLFQVGCGTNNEDRKNALTIYNSGEVTIPTIPQSTNEVLRYGDLIPNGNGVISTENGFDIKVGSVQLVKQEQSIYSKGTIKVKAEENIILQTGQNKSFAIECPKYKGESCFSITSANNIQMRGPIQLIPHKDTQAVEQSIKFYNRDGDVVGTTIQYDKITSSQFIGNLVGTADTSIKSLSADVATKATLDSQGNDITTTYIKYPKTYTYANMVPVLSSGNVVTYYQLTGDVKKDAIVKRSGSAGQVKVPYTPADSNHATSKQYVDEQIQELLDKIEALEKEIQLIKNQ